ncbi:MAG: hypothetical protein N2510_08835 [Ignavibacteria bacterium]|nr:hypothetical protein [Ignavibacteria bacterium]
MKNHHNKKQKNYLQEKVFEYSLVIILLLLVFLASSYKVSGDDDFFWHLATGRYIAEHKTVPDSDVFGYATAGDRWIPFEWGWDVLTYGLYNLGGYNLILVFRSLMFCIIFLIYYLLLRRFGINIFLALFMLFVLLVSIMDRLSPRPHIFTYLFFVCLLYILINFKYGDRKKYTRYLYLIPLIFLLWSNIHMGVLAGGLIMFVFTVSETIIYLKPSLRSADSARLDKREFRFLWIISVTSAIMLLVNPHGLNTYIYAYDHTKLKMLETVNEWQNPFSTKMDFGFIVTLYRIFLFSGIIVIIYGYLKRDLLFILMTLAFAIYSVRAIRFTVDYEIIMLFFITVSLNFFIKKSTALFNFLSKPAPALLLGVFMIYVISQIPSNNIYNQLKYYRIFGWGINDEFIPVQLFNFMKEHKISGTPFNHFGTGGYLVWNFPEQKNYIDSRNLNDEIYNEYNQIIYMKPGFEKIMQDRGMDYAIYLDPDLIRRPKDMQYLITNYLNRNPQWKLVFWDDKSMLFLKDIPKFREVNEKYSYEVLNPYNALFHKSEFEEKVRNNKQRALDELNRKSKEEPQGVLYMNLSKMVTRLTRQ